MMNTRLQYLDLRQKQATVYILCMALVAGLLPGIVQANEIISITPGQAYDLIQQEKDNPDFVIIDIRTPTEFKKGHIEDAILINYYSRDFLTEIDSLDRDRTYLMYCETSVRTTSSYRFIKRLDFKTFYMMIPGMAAWRENELPIVK